MIAKEDTVSSRNPEAGLENTAAGDLLANILSEAKDEDGRFRAFLDALNRGVRLPSAASVVGEPVEVLAFRYDGNPRRGITARCRRKDGKYNLSLADVRFPEGSDAAAPCLPAYRAWLGLGSETAPATAKKPKAAPGDFEPGSPVDLVVLAIRESTARCRRVGTQREATLRSGDLWDVVPGEIATVRVRKRWSYAVPVHRDGWPKNGKEMGFGCGRYCGRNGRKSAGGPSR